MKSRKPSDFRPMADLRKFGGRQMNLRHSKRKHLLRADIARPCPKGLVTPERRYLTELVERFGTRRVGKWGAVTYRFPADHIIEMNCNGARFHAVRTTSTLAIYRAGRIENGELQDAVPICEVRDVESLEKVVVGLSPEVPEPGWSFEEWLSRQHNGELG